MLTEDQKFCAHMAKVLIGQAQARRESKYKHQREFINWLLIAAAKKRAEYLNHIRCSLNSKQEEQLNLF